MIAEEKAKWIVHLIEISREWYWSMFTEDDIGLMETRREGNNPFLTKRKAMNNFKKYAKINKITDYEFEEIE